MSSKEYSSLLGEPSPQRSYAGAAENGLPRKVGTTLPSSVSSTSSSTSSSSFSSSSSSSNIPPPTGLYVDRETLLQVVTRRRDRAVACRSLPAALLVYSLAMYTIIEHGRIAESYDVETGLVDNVVYAGDAGFPGSVWVLADFYSYLNEEWIPSVLNTYDVNGDPIEDLNLRGRVTTYNLIVGGVRLTQKRGTDGDCQVPSVRALYGPCHSPSTAGSAVFGNTTAAIELGVESAFYPTGLDNEISYEFFFNPVDDVEVNYGYGYALQTAGWLDAYTESVKIQLATVNGEVGFFGRVEMVASFKRGGKLIPTFTVTSIPIDPYLQYPWVQALDILFILYLVYMIMGTLRRVLKICRTSRGCADTISQLCTWFRLLDYAVVCTLLSCAILFSSVLSQLSDIRSFVSPDSSPADYAQASDLQLKILAVADTFRSFKTAMVWLTIFLSGRLYKYFTFQPRLAVMVEAFSRAFVDLAHAAVVFAVILTMFGVWGHFMFGTQAFDWRDIPNSITSVIRFTQYDYDLVAMEQTFPAMADFYFCAMLLGVTNLTIWMFFGVVLEVYSEVRAERLAGPTIWQETVAFLSSTDSMGGGGSWWGMNGSTCWGFRCNGSLARLFCSCCRCCDTSTTPSSGSRRNTSWPEVIAVLTTGPLKDAYYITPAQLRTHLGLSEYSARLLLADVLSTKSDDSFYGGASAAAAAANELTPELAAQLAKLEKSRSFSRSKSNVMMIHQGANLFSEEGRGEGREGGGNISKSSDLDASTTRASIQSIQSSISSLVVQMAQLQRSVQQQQQQQQQQQ